MLGKIILLSALAAGYVFAAEAALKIDDLKKMNFFKNPGLSILGIAPVNGDITLVSASAQTSQGVHPITIFITNDKKNIIVGSGYNDKTGEQLTIPVDMSGHQKDAAITFGKGKKDLYVFTDPECPYCKKMDLEVLSKLSPDEYTIRVYLFPLSMHQHSEAMSLWIMSKKTTADKMKALYAISNDSTEYENASYTEAERGQLKASLAKQMAIAQTLGVSGTPTLFDAKGSPVNWMSLAQKK